MCFHLRMARPKKPAKRGRRIPGGFWTKFNREREFIEEFLVEQQSSNNCTPPQYNTKALKSIASIKSDLINEVRKKGLVDDEEDASAVTEADEPIAKANKRKSERKKPAKLVLPKPSITIFQDEIDEQTVVRSGVNENNNVIAIRDHDNQRVKSIALKTAIAFTEKLINQLKLSAKSKIPRVILTRNPVIDEKGRSLIRDGWNKENALLAKQSLANGMDGFKILVKRCPATNEYKIVSPQLIDR